ncbi:hypothetical protein ACQ4PT_063617 [Festuca glaucescens]
MAPLVGGGDNGGLVERPTRPKPIGGGSSAPLRQRSQGRPEGGSGGAGAPGPRDQGGPKSQLAIHMLRRTVAALDRGMDTAVDGNWDDGHEGEEGLGFRQGAESQIGGIVDMADDVYLEFNEEEEMETKKPDPNTWKLLARYKANFRPSAKAMFEHFADDVWRLRTGIRYSERGRNYYMITLYSKGDYDFVMRGGPWIFNKNALLVKDFDAAAQPSETVLNSVPIWVRIYNVPWGKQNETWGMRYGNGLGKAMEVDVPSDDQDENEFLRVRVDLPYDRRLQTQITTGVKGKPGEIKVFKLKYERVPYYCSHCGFMGHKKNQCEKQRLGVPSLDYKAYELRCSPYKKFEHMAHYVPPPGHESSLTPEVGSRQDLDEEEMPPLEDDIASPYDFVGEQVGARDGFEEEEKPAPREIELNLAARVDAMQVESPARSAGAIASQPIIRFPDDDANTGAAEYEPQVNITMTPNMLAHMQRMHEAAAMGSSEGRKPTYIDMIPALRNLSHLQVSFGSVSDVSMPPADTVLGKRTAEENEVQGGRLELSLGLNYGGQA